MGSGDTERLPAESNFWCVVTGIAEDCSPNIPALVTRNLLPLPGQPDLVENLAVVEPGTQKKRLGVVIKHAYGVLVITDETIQSEAVQKLFRACDHPHAVLRP